MMINDNCALLLGTFSFLSVLTFGKVEVISQDTFNIKKNYIFNILGLKTNFTTSSSFLKAKNFKF